MAVKKATQMSEADSFARGVRSPVGFEGPFPMNKQYYAWILVAASLLAACVPTGVRAAGAVQSLTGHVPAAVARLQSSGRLAATNRLALAISLPPRNPGALADLLRRLYDPSSPDYRHYLTPAQFTERFGATDQDYRDAIAYAQAQGFIVTATHPNRLVLDVSAAVSDIERAFSVVMRVYPHPRENRNFYAPDAEPSLNLTTTILHIGGLDNYALPHPQFTKRPAALTAQVTPNVGTGSGPSGNYMGRDFRAAYMPGTPLTGAGQSVGLLQFDGYANSDITYYESQASIPNIPLVNVLIDGATGAPSGNGGEIEVSLDIEMVASMAPGVSSIIVYMAPNPSPWVDLLSRMANDNLAKQLSCSWGGGLSDPACEIIFEQMAAQGQTFFNATGDSCAFTDVIEFPSDSPNVTQVGGTTLTTSGPGGPWVSEKVWNWGGGSGSSGGISTYYTIPSWQQGVSMASNQGSIVMRNVPDVALTADNVYVRADGADQLGTGGTSCAAPLWAGVTALANQEAAADGLPPLGFLNPTLYAIGKGANYTAAFHDTTTGDNTSPTSPGKFFAVTGYDLCTGWGTPKGQNAIRSIVFAGDWTTPTGTFVVNGAPGVPPYLPSNTVYTVFNPTTNDLVWNMSYSQPWLQISPTQVTVTAHASAAVTATVDQVAATALAAGTYVDTVGFTNSAGLGCGTRQVVLRIGRNYSLQGADYAWIDPVANGHTALNSASGNNGPYALPFDFLFYDATNRSIYVSAFGLLGFDASSGAATGDNAAVPDPASPNAIVCPLWDDLDLSAASAAVYMGIQGTAPNRKVVVTWMNARHASDSSALYNFQAILQEGVSLPGINNDIVFNYKDVAENSVSVGSGQSATIGIEDQLGTLGKRYSYNGENWLANGRALRFTQDPQTSTNPPVGQIQVLGKTGSSVAFEITFSEPVTGLDSSGLVLVNTVPGATLGAIAGGGFRYLVSVDNVAGLGAIQLSVRTGAVQDYNGNPNAFFGPAVFTMPLQGVNFQDDMERGPGAWLASTQQPIQVVTAAWQWGVPTYSLGPTNTPSGSSCWGTVLDGVYSNSMDAWLQMAPMAVGASPTVGFKVWYDFDVLDYGYVEVNCGSGWINVTPSDAFSGTSGGWVPVQVALDDSFYGNRTIRVRFRATSTSGSSGTHAGMYVDDVVVTSYKAPGIWVVGYTPTNGSPGITASIWFTAYNSTTQNLTGVTGTIGSPDPGVSFAGSQVVNYGTMAAGAIATGQPPSSVVLGAPGNFAASTVQLFHSVTLAGIAPSQDVLPFTIDGLVFPPATNLLTVRASGGVVNWLGQPLLGNGGPAACLFQVLYAGANGIPDAPTAAGQATGDDRILFSYDTHQPWGRFGEGAAVPPDQGMFVKTFLYGLPSNAVVFVRAWDAASFDQAVAYGDSSQITLRGQAAQSVDFGSWIVNKPSNYSKDSNGDSIPDGWCVLHGLDPRQPVQKLPTAVTAAAAVTDCSYPNRVAVSSNFVFIADTGNNRVQVWDRMLTNRMSVFGSPSAAEFSSPSGIAVSPDGTRVAVADTLNKRVRMFAINPVSGTLAPLYSFGSNGTDNAQFNAPMAVGFGPTGDLYVADSKAVGLGNNRVQVFGAVNGAFQQAFGSAGSGNGQFGRALGVGVGSDGTLYEADGPNNRVQAFVGGSAFAWAYGSSGSSTGQFNWVWDVQPGLGPLLYVTDMNNNRVQILMRTGGVAVYVGAITNSGSMGRFNLPRSAVPAPDGDVLYVADTYNSRVLRLKVTLDSDGNGIDDAWELYYFGTIGIDPNADPDGDGVSNIGEYRAGTDPLNPDSNGNGVYDGAELAAGSDPNALGGPITVRIESLSLIPPVVSWLADSGDVCRVQWSTNLLGTNWIDTTTVTSTFRGVTNNVFSATNRIQFLRVKKIAP